MSKQAHKKVETVTVVSEKPSTEVAAAPNSTTVAVISGGFSADDLAADAGAGSQQIKATDLQTPLIYLLQSNSGQCKKSDGRYVAGAVEGSLYNNLTQEVYNGEKGITVVPCYFEKNYIEWKANRGGLAGIHGADTPLKSQIVMTEVKQNDGTMKNVPLLPNGNLLVETNNHYVLIIEEDESFYAAMIPMASTALKPSRQWNTLIKRVQLQDSKGQSFNPASYFMSYKLTTKGRQKDAYTWSTWNIEANGPVVGDKAVLKNGANIYHAAKAFEKAISAGAVKVKIEEPMDDGAAVGATEADNESI